MANEIDFRSTLANAGAAFDMENSDTVRLWVGRRTDDGIPLPCEQLFKPQDLRELAIWLVVLADTLDGKQLTEKPKRVRKQKSTASQEVKSK